MTAMEERVERHGLRVARVLARFLEEEALPGSGVDADTFWSGFAQLVAEMTPRNAALLARRDALQARIDSWFRERRGKGEPVEASEKFLRSIGYIADDVDDFTIDTGDVDPEIASISGPQLVVPITNARYALNAANARWGSLYDALYGTDALGAPPPGPGLDPAHAGRVIAWVRAHLDRVVPLADGSWAGISGLEVRDGQLRVRAEGGESGLANPAQFVGHASDPESERERFFLKVNDLHIIIEVDPAAPVGQRDRAGIADVLLESAVSVIMDCEDSVATVDAADKVLAWRNWLGLMKGDLRVRFSRGGREIDRALNEDLTFAAPDGRPARLPGRALMMVRNVGLLTTNPAILDAGGNEVFEGLMDAAVTVLIACHDLRREGGPRNSPAGSVYVVKPKLHGPEEVSFAVETFDMVERFLGLPRNSVKLGIMDEERRTSVNLKACIRAARHRLAFINTGFLDRTGDEIHTAMEAGPVVGKGEMKHQEWLRAYEARNVEIGLACGLSGRAQIGKGMWAMPERMADMLREKVAHPEAGASCAWVPSPTAATLHATHYHLVDVSSVQRRLAAGAPRAGLRALLRLPLADPAGWSGEEITAELENACQGILGYVVRWVDLGIGCSKVPDIHDVALMEDRATCRISAQLLANWLHHGVIGRERLLETMRKMAVVVDRQNAGVAHYRAMAPGFDGEAFRAACDLVLEGRAQPSGYTEPILHAARLRVKAKAGG